MDTRPASAERVEAALDTSWGAAFALSRAGVILLSRNQPATLGPGGDSALGGWIGECMRTAGVALDDIDRWTVGTGPGSFSGLRVGIAFVKGLCHPRRKPYRGIASSLALARMAAGTDSGAATTVAVLHDARQGQVIVSQYLCRTGIWQETGPAEILPHAAVAARVSGCARVACVQERALRPLLEPALARRTLFLAAVDAACLLGLPHEYWPDTAADRERSAVPIYVRPAVFVPPLAPPRAGIGGAPAG